MAPAEAGTFRFVGERERVRGHFFSLVSATFVDPSGFTFEREIIRHPGAVCAVPLDADGTVLMVRQYRAAVDRQLLEVPAGKRDVPGEAPEICVRRELAEEVGRESAQLVELGRFLNSPGFSDEETICYLAEQLSAVDPSAHGIEEEHMTIEQIRLADIWSLIASGEIIDAKTIIALTLAERLVAGRASS